MADTGWYPDPSGEPNRFRYWDGSSWSNETTDDPTSPVPGGPAHSPDAQSPDVGSPDVGSPYAQSPYAGSPYSGSPYGQQGSAYGAGAFATGSGDAPDRLGNGPERQGGRPKWLIPVAIVAAVLVIAAGIGAALALTSGSDDTDATADPGTSESSDPSPDQSPGESPDGQDASPDQTRPPGADFVNCEGGQPLEGSTPAVAGKIAGGGITATIPPGYVPEPRFGEAFAFGTDTDAAFRPIEEFWISTMVVGRIEKSNGFTSPEQAAHAITECMARAETLYSGYQGTTDVHDKATTVDGEEAWSYRTEIRVKDPRVQVEGDVAEVTVIDTGDGEGYAFFIGVTPIGDQELLAAMDETVASITVE